MKRKLFTLDTAFPFRVLSLGAGLLFVYAHVSVKAQQTPHFTPTAPSANKQDALTPRHKGGKAPASAQKPGIAAGLQTAEVNRFGAAWETRYTLQQKLTEAVQEEKSLQERLAILQKEFGAGQTEPGSPLRAKQMRQIEETQARLTDKQVFILNQKQLLAQNASTIQNLFSDLSQNKRGAAILPQEPGTEARTLQFTSADAAQLRKWHLLFTPEDQKRVKFLPKSDGGTNKP